MAIRVLIDCPIVEGITKVSGGYIVKLPRLTGLGDRTSVCDTLDDVFDLLIQTDPDPVRRIPKT